MIIVSDTSPISNLIQIGTKMAKAHGLDTIGLIGCLITAKKQSIIKEIRPIVEELETKAGFYVGETFKESIYRIAGE